MRLRPILGLMLVILLLAGCVATGGSGPSPKQVSIQELFAGIHCGPPAKGARAQWIDRPDHLKRICQWPHCPGRRPVATIPIQWDPDKEGGLWIQMGAQPTGGYGLHLAAPMATVTQGVALITVHWRRPPPDAFVPQVITHPCLLLKVPRGDFQTVHIQDQTGAVQLRVQVPAR